MRLNDTFPVMLQSDGQSFHVADAVVVEVDGDEVVLEIPSTVVKMGLATSLTEPRRDPSVPDQIFDDGVRKPANVDEQDAQMRAHEREVVDDDYVPRSEQRASIHNRDLDSSVLD